MLRNRQHGWTAPPPWTGPRRTGPRGDLPTDLKTEILAELVDTLDLYAFVHKPAYRRRLNLVLACFSDEEFDRFERLYSRRFTAN